MTQTFLILTIALIIVAVAMVLIILVQRPQGGGLASAFGGAGGGGTDTVFGGRVGDALTVMTVVAFVLFLGLAVALNLVESKDVGEAATPETAITSTEVDPNAPAGTFTGENVEDSIPADASNNNTPPETDAPADGTE